MYENIGKKIKGLAQVFGWLWLIAGIIWAFIFWAGKQALLGFIPLIGGGMMCISSWILYGFGQLVEDISAIRNKPTQTVKAPVVVDELPEL
ncbi:MAG: hypothetical protein J6D00_08595 [Christensenellaceae bacterium]|nr:hypothetical protein [Christensenellaceae bacterium]